MRHQGEHRRAEGQALPPTIATHGDVMSRSTFLQPRTECCGLARSPFFGRSTPSPAVFYQNFLFYYLRVPCYPTKPLSRLRSRWTLPVLSLQGSVSGGPVSPGAEAPVTGSSAQQQQQRANPATTIPQAVFMVSFSPGRPATAAATAPTAEVHPIVSGIHDNVVFQLREYSAWYK